MKTSAILVVISLLWCETLYAQTDIAQHLQDISVTIKAPGTYRESQGSGVIITREVKETADSEPIKVNFIWTAAHVVDSLRTTRMVIDPATGLQKTVVEFKPAFIVKELVDEGRRVGELKLEVVVIKYSDADQGEDLALLMVRKKGFVDKNTEFFFAEDIVPTGTPLFHVGSLLGQLGANSMTDGIVSQIGRVLNLGNGSNTATFDQTTVTAFPGSSGGGVFLATEDEHRGKYVGMLVRGAGETFNLIVPIRRMRSWAESAEVAWALDPAVEMPTLEDLKKLPVEDLGIGDNWSPKASTDTSGVRDAGTLGGRKLRFWIGYTRTVIFDSVPFDDE